MQSGVSQSSIIFAYLAVAFVIFITMRGELRTYWGLLAGTASAPGAAANTAPVKTSGVTVGTALSALGTATQALELAAA